MSVHWQWMVVAVCIVVSAASLSLHAWPAWPARARRALALRLLRAPQASRRYRLGRRLAPPARIKIKSTSGADCGGCSGCALDRRNP